MTNKEAKNIVEQHLSELLSNPLVKLDEIYVKAERMAIKALEQEPTKEEKALLQKWRDNKGISIEEFGKALDELQEPQTDEQVGNSDKLDCIGRAEALRQAKEWRNNEFIRVTNPYYYLEKRLNDLPPVNPPQPKIGHWIKSQDCYGNNHFTCSCCGHDIATKADIWDDNYCSNCGSYNGGKSEVEE